MDFKVAVVEDDGAARQSLDRMIRKYAEEKGHGIQVDCFPEGYRFIADYKSDYDVLFLDIEMPGINGIDVAKKVRQNDDNVIIVFVTNMAQYAVDGYEVQAFDYILKPVTYYGFIMKFDRICKELFHKLNDYHILMTNRTQTKNVNIFSILYVEVKNHELIFHMFDENFRMRGTISEMEKKLAPYHFVRCNSCYLVNLKYVESMRGDWLVINGRELRMSQLRKQAFLCEFAKYAGGSI